MAWAFSLNENVAVELIMIISLSESCKSVADFFFFFNHELCVSFVNKPNPCILFLRQSWPVVSLMKGWVCKMLRKMMRSQPNGAQHAGLLWILQQVKFELWLFYHLLSSSILADFLFVVHILTQSLRKTRRYLNCKPLIRGKCLLENLFLECCLHLQRNVLIDGFFHWIPLLYSGSYRWVIYCLYCGSRKQRVRFLALGSKAEVQLLAQNFWRYVCRNSRSIKEKIKIL